MRRVAALILWLAWAAALTSCALRSESYGEWFWSGSGLDWGSILGSVATAMFGGALRTLVTLLSRWPTFRVALQGVADTITSSLTGIPMFVLLLLWSTRVSPVGHDAHFALLFLAGMLGRTFFRKLDEGLQDGMGLAVESGRRRLAAWLGLPVPPPLPPAPDGPEPPTFTQRASDTPPADVAGTAGGTTP